MKRQIFELRFFPILAFFDQRSELLDHLYRDPKTKKKNFEHWQLTDGRVDTFDADKKRSFFFSFQNCGFVCVDPPTENYSKDQIQKYFGIAMEIFGEHIEQVRRVGFRETQVIPVEDFDKLSRCLAETFLRTENAFFKSLGASVYDLQLFPIIFKHGTNKFQITLGPTPREQLKTLWGDEVGLPEQALYLDIDYYSVEPSLGTDIRAYVADFISKARGIQNRIWQELRGAGVLPPSE